MACCSWLQTQWLQQLQTPLGLCGSSVHDPSRHPQPCLSAPALQNGVALAGSSQQDSNTPECSAPQWQDNQVAPGGYGNNTAFPPSRINVVAEPFLSYVSNGSVPLPMTITIRDAADTIVTAGEAQVADYECAKDS